MVIMKPDYVEQQSGWEDPNNGHHYDIQQESREKLAIFEYMWYCCNAKYPNTATAEHVKINYGNH